MSKAPPSYKTPKALQPLPVTRLDEVKRLLRSGKSPSKVATEIQQEWKLLTKVKKPTLVKALARYRDLAATDIEAIEDLGLRKTAAAMKRQVQGQIDVMDTYSELIGIQMARIRTTFEIECDTGYLTKQMGNDIDVANRLLSGMVGTAIRANVLQHLIPEKDVTPPTPDSRELAGHVLERPQLKEGLMAVIGSVLRDVQTFDQPVSDQ